MKNKLIIIFFLFFSSLINSYSQDIRAYATLDTNTVFVGDTLQLKLSVIGTKELRIAFPEIPKNINGIEVRSISPIDTVKRNDSIKLTQKIALQPFDTGNITIPSFIFQLIDKDNAKQTIISTDSLVLTVNSYRSDTAKTIVDIKVPLEEPLTFWDYLPYIIVGLIIIAGAIFAYRKWKKRKKEPEETIHIDIEKIPYVWALDELNKLQKEQLWQNRKFKEHFTKLSDILRAYIEKKFEQPALEMTTYEIVNNLKMIYLPSDYINLLKDVLNISDLVKFAKHIPMEEECIDSFNNAVEFVKKSSTHKALIEINQEA